MDKGAELFGRVPTKAAGVAEQVQLAILLSLLLLSPQSILILSNYIIDFPLDLFASFLVPLVPLGSFGLLQVSFASFCFLRVPFISLGFLLIPLGSLDFLKISLVPSGFFNLLWLLRIHLGSFGFLRDPFNFLWFNLLLKIKRLFRQLGLKGLQSC